MLWPQLCQSHNNHPFFKSAVEFETDADADADAETEMSVIEVPPDFDILFEATKKKKRKKYFNKNNPRLSNIGIKRLRPLVPGWKR